MYDLELKREALVDLVSDIYFKKMPKDRKTLKEQIENFLSDLDAMDILIEVFNEDIIQYIKEYM